MTVAIDKIINDKILVLLQNLYHTYQFITFPMTQVVFAKNESEILHFFYNNSFIGKFTQKRVGRSPQEI